MSHKKLPVHRVKRPRHARLKGPAATGPDLIPGPEDRRRSMAAGMAITASNSEPAASAPDFPGGSNNSKTQQRPLSPSLPGFPNGFARKRQDSRPAPFHLHPPKTKPPGFPGGFAVRGQSKGLPPLPPISPQGSSDLFP